VTKEADNTITKEGDTVHFTITVDNTGDVDLVLDTFTDTLMGDISANFSGTLLAGDDESWGYDYVVLGTEGDPLTNTAEAHYDITGLPNDITDSDTVEVDVVNPGDTVEVDVVNPDFTLTKTADPTVGTVGTTITYTMVITNTGDVQLNRVSVNDTLMGDITADFPLTLTPGVPVTVTATRDIQPGDPNPLVNVVTAVYQVDGLPNQLTREADASVEVLKEFRKEFTDPMVWVGPEPDAFISLEQWHIGNGTPGEEWVPLFTKIKWTVTFYVPNNSGNDWTDVVLRDRFGAELDVYGTTYTLNGDTHDITPLPILQITKNPPGDAQGVGFHYSKAKKMPQLRITWYIDDLDAGEMETLSFNVVTRLNPGGNQEFTSPGLHILNSGAVLKWRDADNKQDSMSTPSVYVMAGDTFGAIVGFVTDCEGDPVPRAEVELWPSGITATADEHGFYYFPKVVPGDYEVKYYDILTESVTVTGGDIEEVDFPFTITLGIGTSGGAIASWSTAPYHSGDKSAHLMTTGTAGTGNEARVQICLPEGTTLGDIESISWWTYLVSGYVPHVDIVLDKDNDTVRDDVLVAEGAYQNGDSTTGWSSPPWFETFDGASATYPGWSGLIGTPSVTEVDDTSAVWLWTSYKAGTAVGTVDSNTVVLALEIEVDNWVLQTEAYVDDIEITLSP